MWSLCPLWWKHLSGGSFIMCILWSSVGYSVQELCNIVMCKGVVIFYQRVNQAQPYNKWVKRIVSGYSLIKCVILWVGMTHLLKTSCLGWLIFFVNVVSQHDMTWPIVTRISSYMKRHNFSLRDKGFQNLKEEFH